MSKVKLGKKAASFSDPVSKLTLAGTEVKDLPKGPHSWILRNAIKGGHLVVVHEEPAKVPLTRTEELLELTRKEIMAKFDFIDEDHLAEADKKGTKAELVEYLLSIEEAYE